jgi:hypothetical protein
LLWITLHDMDIAHSGAYSLYLEGIQRTDRLCAEIWQMIENDPEYKGRTTMLILPDFGRDSDFSASGNGFSTPSDWRPAFTNDLDDGPWTTHSPEQDCRQVPRFP